MKDCKKQEGGFQYCWSVEDVPRLGWYFDAAGQVGVEGERCLVVGNKL